MDPSASLDDILQVPVVETHWFVRREDPNLTRWGLIWRAYNIVQDLGLDYMEPILGPGRIREDSSDSEIDSSNDAQSSGSTSLL